MFLKVLLSHCKTPWQASGSRNQCLMSKIPYLGGQVLSLVLSQGSAGTALKDFGSYLPAKLFLESKEKRSLGHRS